MRPNELTDDGIDQALRRQPRWTPPRHFAQAVVRRRPAATAGAAWPEESRGSALVQGVTVGICGGGLAYVGGVAIRHAVPVLTMNAEIVGWIGAAAGLLIAAAVNGLAEEWI
jgi:hypothetical protein